LLTSSFRRGGASSVDAGRYLCCSIAARRDSTSIVAWRALAAPPCGASCCKTAQTILCDTQMNRDQRRFGPSAAAVRGADTVWREPSGDPGRPVGSGGGLWARHVSHRGR